MAEGRDRRKEVAERYGIAPTADAMRAEAERRRWRVVVPPALDGEGRATCRLVRPGHADAVGHGSTAEDALADALLRAGMGEGRV